MHRVDASEDKITVGLRRKIWIAKSFEWKWGRAYCVCWLAMTFSMLVKTCKSNEVESQQSRNNGETANRLKKPKEQTEITGFLCCNRRRNLTFRSVPGGGGLQFGSKSCPSSLFLVQEWQCLESKHQSLEHLGAVECCLHGIPRGFLCPR